MKTKVISLALAALSAVTLTLSACGDRDPLKSSSEDKRIVMTVKNDSGSEKVKYQEYRYFWLNNKRDLYGEDAELTDEQLEKLKTLVENNITDRHALRLLAAENGIELTSEDEVRIDAYVDSFKTDCGSDEAYVEQLLYQYLNEPFFRELTADTTIAYALLDEMAESGALAVSEEDFANALETDEILCLKEIYVTYPTAETKAWAERHIEEAMEKLSSGESTFEELMLEYSSYNPAELPPEHGYYTMQYDAIDEVWDAAKTLEEGEYSEIVESAFGFHIVLRAEKDLEYADTLHDDLYETFRQSSFYKLFYEYKENVTVEYNDFDLPED